LSANKCLTQYFRRCASKAKSLKSRSIVSLGVAKTVLAFLPRLNFIASKCGRLEKPEVTKKPEMKPEMNQPAKQSIRRSNQMKTKKKDIHKKLIKKYNKIQKNNGNIFYILFSLQKTHFFRNAPFPHRKQKLFITKNNNKVFFFHFCSVSQTIFLTAITWLSK